MKKILLVTVLFFGICFSSFAQQKAKKEVKISAKKVEKTRGSNPNIKKDFDCNALDVAVAKPAKSRGDLCEIKFDNYTGFNVKVYVDGEFKGWVYPWEDGDVSVYGGFTTIYCITAGGSLEWSAEGNCESSYVFTLNANTAN